MSYQRERKVKTCELDIDPGPGPAFIGGKTSDRFRPKYAKNKCKEIPVCVDNNFNFGPPDRRFFYYTACCIGILFMGWIFCILMMFPSAREKIFPPDKITKAVTTTTTKSRASTKTTLTTEKTHQTEQKTTAYVRPHQITNKGDSKTNHTTVQPEKAKYFDVESKKWLSFDEAEKQLPVRTKATTKEPSFVKHREKVKFQVGVARADITLAASDLEMLGHYDPRQIVSGVHTRMYSKAYCITQGKRKIVYVVVDLHATSYDIRHRVIKMLRKNSTKEYSIYNVHIAATGTYATPGGYLAEYMLGVGPGYYEDSVKVITEGIFKSIKEACASLTDAHLILAYDKIYESQYNRSPYAHAKNPFRERLIYWDVNVDETVTQLRMEDVYGRVLGIVNWFAQTPCSMRFDNSLISADNFGYAALEVEKHLDPDSLAGEGTRLVSVVPSNGGDISPNTGGGKCYNKQWQWCAVKSDCWSGADCGPSGPDRADNFGSVKIIGDRIYKGIMRALKKTGKLLNGDLHVKYFLYNSYNQSGMSYSGSIQWFTPGDVITVCSPMLGDIFFLGPYDSWCNNVMSIKRKIRPKADTIAQRASRKNTDCQYKKTPYYGYLKEDLNTILHPKLATVNLINIAGLMVVGIPGFVSTMSGRRMLSVINETMKSTRDHFVHDVVVNSLLNENIMHIVTAEEYDVQMFEGQVTINGKHTLAVILNILFDNIVKGYEIDPTIAYDEKGLENEDRYHRMTNNVFRQEPFNEPLMNKDFGTVIYNPAKTAKEGDTVWAEFVAPNPRTNNRLYGTFMSVEKEIDVDYEGEEGWQTVAKDADWRTRFTWHSANKSAIVMWEVPKDATPGKYRMRYFGNSFYDQKERQGTSATFVIS